MRPAVPASLLLPALALLGCDSAETKAARIAPDVIDALKSGDLAGAREKAEKVKGWSEYHLEETRRRSRFPEIRYYVEGQVIVGKAAPEDVDAYVALLEDAELKAWWERRRPLLAAWKGRKDTPRVTVTFDSLADDDTRRAVLYGLAMNADGLAFEAEVKQPRSYAGSVFPYGDDKPLRTLPASVLGESLGTLAVEVSTDSTAYQSSDGKSAYLTTKMSAKLKLSATKPMSWSAPLELKVDVPPPTEVSGSKHGGVSSSREESALFELRVRLTRKLEEAPTLRLAK